MESFAAEVAIGEDGGTRPNSRAALLDFLQRRFCQAGAEQETILLQAVERICMEELGPDASERQLCQQLRSVGVALAEEIEQLKPEWATKPGRSGLVVEELRQMRQRRQRAKDAFAAQEAIHRALRERQQLELTEEELEIYRKSAPVVGSKSWSQATVQWVLDELQHPGGANEVRMLDVGSSYGAWVALPHCVALDLAPAVPSVWQADFLQLKIEEFEDTHGESTFKLNSTGELRSLRSGAFDAVVLSLVLSFLPTPKMRREMLDRAHRCLHSSGSLFVIEKASLCRDGRAKAAVEEFQKALEAPGFRCQKYSAVGKLAGERRSNGHAHAWHLRPGGTPRASPLPMFKEDHRDDYANPSDAEKATIYDNINNICICLR
eukprot:Skav224454  [mRNA]  locus=scaffold3438:57140:58273:+ [translate_table: standard]